MHRSGGLWGIVQQHGVALHGLLGISELTPCAQKRREAGRPVGADMAPDDPVLLRQLTQTICPSELMQQTAPRCVFCAVAGCTEIGRSPRTRHARGRGGHHTLYLIVAIW